jgi:hypothetical protein
MDIGQDGLALEEEQGTAICEQFIVVADRRPQNPVLANHSPIKSRDIQGGLFLKF